MESCSARLPAALRKRWSREERCREKAVRRAAISTRHSAFGLETYGCYKSIIFLVVPSITFRDKSFLQLPTPLAGRTLNAERRTLVSLRQRDQLNMVD